MKHAALLLLAVILCSASTAIPAGQVKDDPSAPVRQFIDGFNSGNVDAAYATYATGSITIVDEFAPHLWSGPNAAHEWAADYDKHAQATGVSEGKVTYGKTTRTEVKGDFAYLLLPTVYIYKERGKAMKEEGQITAVMNRENGAWKIRAWTWSGVKPHAAN